MGYQQKAVIAAVILLMAIGCNNATTEAPKDTTTAATTKPAAPDATSIFRANCSSCHYPDKDGIGPAIKGALTRWNNDPVRLKSFIRNSGKMIADGDPYAVDLYNKWGKTNMTAFSNISEEDLDALLTLMK